MFKVLIIMLKNPTISCSLKDHTINSSMSHIEKTLSSDINTKSNSYMTEKDFDYNKLKILKLRRIKMPYINCNRDLLANSDKDLIDLLLLDKNLLNQIINKTSIFQSRIESVRHSIATILDTKERYQFNINEKKCYTSNNYLGLEIDSDYKRLLNEELILLKSTLELGDSVLIEKKAFTILLKVIDDYVFEDLNPSLFLNRIKPSIVLADVFKKELMSFNQTVNILLKFIDVYDKVNNIIESTIFLISKIAWNTISSDGYTSCVLINNVFVRWCIMVDIGTILRIFIKDKDKQPILSDKILLYSMNFDSIIEELSETIKILINESTENIPTTSNIQRIFISNEIFGASIFDSYELTLLDKKYLIKIFNKRNTTILPSGLSTAYLNIHGNFANAGYMGFNTKIDKTKNFIFLSVEEKMDLFFKTDNFDVFKNNEKQVLNFIIDFLHVLDTINMYMIKLLDTKMLFAVNKSTTRWRFRVDDIYKFEYIKEYNSYENHSFLINTLNQICNTINNRTIFDYMKYLQRHAEDLKNAEHPYYIEILISQTEQKLNNI